MVLVVDYAHPSGVTGDHETRLTPYSTVRYLKWVTDGEDPVGKDSVPVGKEPDGEDGGETLLTPPLPQVGYWGETLLTLYLKWVTGAKHS
jgi:hypothetical protein